MQETIDNLINGDQQLFLWLNSLHHLYLDTIMAWITNKYTWIPMYLVLLYKIVRTYGRTGWIYFLAMIVAVILADFVTSGIMKPFFERPRPCHDPVIGHLVHQVTGCGGRFGFASSHASTSFAVITSLWLFTKDRLKWMKWLFIWPLIYSYSRVYVGVHYPGDILTGALVGILVALIIHKTLKINKIAKIIA
jgi:undecaprenyl-diphosphatase